MKKIIVGFIVIGLAGIGTFFWQQPKKNREIQAFATEKVESIQVMSSQRDIAIKRGKGDKIEVEAESIDKNEQLDVQVNERILKIRQKGETKDFFGGFSFGKTSTITVKVPENMQQEIDITSGSGNISIANVTSKKLSSSTKSGEIFLTKVKGIEQKLQSSSGDIAVRSNQTEKLSVQTISGDVTIKEFNEKGNTDIQSKTGEINVNFQNTPENLTAKVVGKEVEATIFGKGESGQQTKKFGEGKNRLVIESLKGSIFLN